MSTKALVAVATVVVALLALPLVAQTSRSMPGHRTPNGAQAAPARTNPVRVPAVPNLPAPSRVPTMTRAQFNQLNGRVTYAQCVRFIGCEGRRVRSPGPGAEEYAWQLLESPSSTASSGEATLTFQNGVLCGKGFNSNQGQRGDMATMLAAAVPEQRPAVPPFICRSVYDALKEGATYADCARLLGAEGRFVGRQTASAGTYAPNGTPIPARVDVYVWQNPTVQATLTLSFRDGKLAGRQIARSTPPGANR